jgi:hypothetical protein
MSKLFMSVVAIGFLAAGPVTAADLDNNGIAGDETYIPGEFNGESIRDETVIFPTSADTWDVLYYPYWWNVGDTVYGVYDVDLDYASHVDLVFKISYTVLNSGGHVDLDFRINGTTVGSFVVTEADGTGYIYQSFDFDPIAPPFELRYYETNTVDPGEGSISIDETGLCSATFSGGATPTERTSWGRVKEFYR